MNKAITDGLQLMPPQFVNGLGAWSSQDGTPGSDTYLNVSNAAFVPADQDFSGCLEINKTTTTTQLRYMGETPILPGCYLRVVARVKAVSGNLPSVRIAAWAGNAQNTNVNGLTEVGPTTQLTAYVKWWRSQQSSASGRALALIWFGRLMRFMAISGLI